VKIKGKITPESAKDVMNTSFGSFVLKKATIIKEKRAPRKEPVEYETRLEFND